MKLTLQDINNAMIFLNRVQLEGKESRAHTELVIKLEAQARELQNPPAPPAPPAVDEDKDPDITED